MDGASEGEGGWPVEGPEGGERLRSLAHAPDVADEELRVWLEAIERHRGDTHGGAQRLALGHAELIVLVAHVRDRGRRAGIVVDHQG